jgi:hypothetical protein
MRGLRRLEAEPERKDRSHAKTAAISRATTQNPFGLPLNG